MKPKRSYKKYRNHATQPSGFSWTLLAFAWICVLPLTAFVFRPHETESSQISRQIQPAFLPFSEEKPEARQPLTLQTQILPAFNALRSDEPTILIYHTHTTEAYMQTETETYVESSKWRTNDKERNVVAVGEVLKEIFEKEYGFHVIHDTTDHEPPKLATSYDRSLNTMEKYHKEYPSIVLFIDLHRDAYAAEDAPCDYLTISGIETAKMMLVVGKGEKYDDKPYFESNEAFANRITAYLNTICPNLCRPVRIKTGRYNQHVAPNCILVEVGHNANTLSQAKAAMPYLAEAIAYSFRCETPSVSDWVPN